MNKEQIIEAVRAGIASGAVSREDILVLASGAPRTGVTAPVKKGFPVSVFYIIGAVIAVTGAVILVGQHFEDIGFPGRLLVTLGVSLATFIVALLMRSKNALSQTLFLASAILAPLGSYILVSDGKSSFDFSAQFFTALMLFVVYAVAQWVARKQILVIVLTALGTWAYYAAFFEMFKSFNSSDWLEWATLFLGAAYMLIAYGYSRLNHAGGDGSRLFSVTEFLYFFGTLGLLGGGIAIGGVFDLVLILLICGTFYLAAYLRSKSMLVLSGLFLMAHIVKISGRYFADSIGWPVTLIICGFLVIGVGYMTYYLNRKYVSKQA